MAKKKRNRYASRTKNTGFLHGLTQSATTKGNVKGALIETGKDLLVGVIAGGLVGAAVGRPSFLIGLAFTAAGHYTDKRLVSLVGLGMMAANGFSTKTTAVSGMDGLDGVKERMLAFRDSMKEKVYLDKIIKPATTAPVAGLGNYQYFNYQQELRGLAALDEVDRQLEESAYARLQMSGTAGLDATEAVEAMEGGLADVEDFNF